MKSRNLTSLIGPAILIVFLCIAFWLYTEWDLKHFRESLPKPPSPQTTNREASPPEAENRLPDATETTQTETGTLPSVPEEKSESVDAERRSDTVAVEEPSADTADFDSLFDMFLEGTDTVSSGDWTDTEETPYDMEIVKAGFDDYNASLQSDPDYAYQRLDDAFREQYGDDPDVDILVEMIRRGNEGPLSMDRAIEGAEAMIRLASKISPPEVIEGLQLFHEMLMESKQMALEEGVEAEYGGTYRIGESQP